MKFDVNKFNFSDEEISTARFEHKLLSLEMEFSRGCNYRCPYCYIGEATVSRDELTIDETKRVIDEAAALGAKKIVILGGEPLLYNKIIEIIDYINSLDMGAEIFTNGSLLNKTMAAELASRNTRVVIKINSLNPEIQDELTGIKDSLNIALNSIKTLQEAGFDSAERLGGSSIISSANLAGIVELYSYLRSHQITPYFEVITPQGRVLDNAHLMIEQNELKSVFEEMAEIDRNLGIDWKPQVPLVGSKCLRHWYSALISSTGVVYPCVGVTIKIGHIRDQSLENIIKSSGVIKKLKQYRDLVKQPCQNCTQSELCYGCRGTAYQLTGDFLAADPTCWHYSKALSNLKVLPYPAHELLPHHHPIVMVDRLIELGEIAIIESKIRADNPFLTSDGRLPEAALIELAAQAAGVAHSWENDFKIMPGILSGVSNTQFFGVVNAGDLLHIAVKELTVFESWYLVEFNITCNDKLRARGELKLCLSSVS